MRHPRAATTTLIVYRGSFGVRSDRLLVAYRPSPTPPTFLVPDLAILPPFTSSDTYQLHSSVSPGRRGAKRVRRRASNLVNATVNASTSCGSIDVVMQEQLAVEKRKRGVQYCEDWTIQTNFA